MKTVHGSGSWDEWHDALRDKPGQKILIIQRDNIGDLVLTTPFLRALRTALPSATIDLISNSYNAPVLAGNSAINHHYRYTKLKHRSHDQSRWRIVFDTWKLYRRLRSEHYDLAIITSAILSDQALKLARAARPRRIAAVAEPADAAMRGIDLALDPKSLPRHTVKLQRVFLDQLVLPEQRKQLPLDLPPCEVTVDPTLRANILSLLNFDRARPLIAFHISARKVDQRWGAELFAALIRRVHSELRANVLLLWAPGASDNPLHPGDDDKAEEIRALTSDVPVLAHVTSTIADLIAVLALTDLVVMSDGGAMHIAAALQRPLVCMFGNSDPEVWQAWGTEQTVLRDSSHTVAALSSDTVFEAVAPLLQRTYQASAP